MEKPPAKAELTNGQLSPPEQRDATRGQENSF
jgi:hypothetical protein